MDTKRSEALEQVGAERPDVLVLLKYGYFPMIIIIIFLYNIEMETKQCKNISAFVILEHLGAPRPPVLVPRFARYSSLTLCN